MISDSAFEQKWVLQGRLCGQWASDLGDRWQGSRNMRAGRTCTIDLEDVTYVDGIGERVLVEMAAEGANLHATRAYMTHVLGSLKQQQQ